MRNLARKWEAFVLLFTINLLFASTLIAQTEAQDSRDLTTLLNLGKEEQIKMLNRLAYELRDTDPMKSIAILQNVIELSGKSEYGRELAMAYSTLGYVQNSLNEFTLALNSYLGAISIYRELESKKDVADLAYQIASLYKTLGDYAKAIEFCHEGLKIYEESNDQMGLALIFRVMGSVFKYQKDYEKSLVYYSEGLKINESIDNEQGVANSYNNMGIVFFEMGENETALNYYKKSLSLNLKNETKSEIAINCGNIGEVFLKMGQSDSAILYFNKNYEAVLALNNKKGIANALLYYGDYYFFTKEYPISVDYYKQALLIARRIGILETTKNIFLKLSSLYDSLYDYQKSFGYFKSYIEVRDSLLNMEALQKVSQLEMEYAFEKERNDHLIKEQRIKLYTIVGFSALLLFILFLALVYMVQNIKLKRRTIEQKNLEIDKKQLQYEVYFKNSELTSKAMYLAERNEFINDLTLRLYKLIHNPESVAKDLKLIIKDIEVHSDSKIWSEFEYTFLQVHPDFFNNLGNKFPQLSPNEKRLSALLRLNLSTKDISNITHQSLHSLTVARTRLRRKLGIANSGENLISFLSQF